MKKRLPPPVHPSAIKNTKELARAFAHDRVAIASTFRKSDGKPVLLLMAVSDDPDTGEERARLIPYAELIQLDAETDLDDLYVNPSEFEDTDVSLN